MAIASVVLLLYGLPQEAARPLTEFGLVGFVKSVAKDDHTLELVQREGTIPVTFGEVREVLHFTSRPLSEIPAGATISVLGLRRRADYYLEPAIQRILIVVRGAPFRPPPIPEELREQKLDWHTGTFDIEHGVPRLGGRRLKLPRKPRVIEVKRVERTDIPPRSKVYVQGRLRVSASDPQIEAQRIAVISPRIPPRQFRFLFRTGRLDAPAEKEKEARTPSTDGQDG